MTDSTGPRPVTVAGDGRLQYIPIGRVPHILECPAGREISLRNVGMNTLYVSTDDEVYFDVACGTSFDIRQKFRRVWFRTVLGRTWAYVLVTN